MLKRERGMKSNGKLPHIFMPSKTATLVPEFELEDLPLDRTAILVSAFAEKRPHLGQNTHDDDDYDYDITEPEKSRFQRECVEVQNKK